MNMEKQHLPKEGRSLVEKIVFSVFITLLVSIVITNLFMYMMINRANRKAVRVVISNSNTTLLRALKPGFSSSKTAQELFDIFDEYRNENYIKTVTIYDFDGMAIQRQDETTGFEFVPEAAISMFEENQGKSYIVPGVNTTVFTDIAINGGNDRYIAGLDYDSSLFKTLNISLLSVLIIGALLLQGIIGGAIYLVMNRNFTRPLIEIILNVLAYADKINSASIHMEETSYNIALSLTEEAKSMVKIVADNSSLATGLTNNRKVAGDLKTVIGKIASALKQDKSGDACKDILVFDLADQAVELVNSLETSLDEEQQKTAEAKTEIDSMIKLTGDNSENSVVSANSCEQLAKLTNRMREVLSELTIVVYGKDSVKSAEMLDSTIKSVSRPGDNNPAGPG
jgi:hypothetical protein